MALPWKVLDHFEVAEEGRVELRQRGEKDFLITLGSQILMNSKAQRSELALGRLGCQRLAAQSRPRVLVGGLGMGYTLRAVLDSLPDDAEVVVAELHPRIVDWCRGPLAGLINGAATDPRVTVAIGDVAELVAALARDRTAPGFDALILDLYRGPHPKSDAEADPLYGRRAIANYHRALKPGGRLAVWGENYDESFFRRLQKGGFKSGYEHPGKGGYRHAVFVGDKGR